MSLHTILLTIAYTRCSINYIIYLREVLCWISCPTKRTACAYEWSDLSESSAGTAKP